MRCSRSSKFIAGLFIAFATALAGCGLSGEESDMQSNITVEEAAQRVEKYMEDVRSTLAIMLN